MQKQKLLRLWPAQSKGDVGVFMPFGIRVAGPVLMRGRGR